MIDIRIANEADVRRYTALIYDPDCTGRLKGAIRDAIRRYYAHSVTRTAVSADDDGTSVCEKLELPVHIFSHDAALSYFMTYFFHPHYNSMYDCTGRPFTNWYKLFQRETDLRWCAYHSWSIDV